MRQYERAEEILTKYSQEHLLSHYKKLEEKTKNILMEQILRIDFEQINNLYQETKKSGKETLDVIEPTPYIDKGLLTQEELDFYKKIGIEELKKGNYAVITMAGGQRNEIADMMAPRERLCWE